MFDNVRRVVTVIDDKGVSRIERDGEPPVKSRSQQGTLMHEVWRVMGIPCDAGDEGDHDFSFMSPPNGFVVRRVEIPPDSMRYLDDEGKPRSPLKREGMHQTATVDIIVVLEGELWLILDSDETVKLRPGDTLVQRSTVHAWRNPTSSVCRYLAIMISANLPNEIEHHPTQLFKTKH